MIWVLLGVIAIILYGPYARELFRRPMSASARATAPGAFADLPRGKTHYQWYEPPAPAPDRPLIVCVHGLTTPSFVWGPIARDLAAKGHRVLSYDHYGRGFSDRPRGAQDMAFFTDQLTALLAHLNITEPVTLLGYSMGGAVVTGYAAQHPDKTHEVILLAPAGLGHDLGPVAQLVAHHRRVGQWLMHLTYARSFRAATLTERDLDRTSIPDIVDLQLNELRYRGFLRAVWSSLYHLLDHNLDADHRQIAAAGTPLLAIWAEQDDIIPVAGADMLSTLNPAARNVIVPDAGHALAYTHTGDVLGALDQLTL